MFKSASLLLAFSLAYACNSGSKKSEDPAPKTSAPAQTTQDSNANKSEQSPSASSQQSSQGTGQTTTQPSTSTSNSTTPSTPAVVEKKDGDPYFIAAEIAKITFVKVYNYFPNQPALYKAANLTTGEIYAYKGTAGKVSKRKAPLTKDEIQKIRKNLAEAKVFKAADPKVCDSNEFGPNFRLDYSLDGKAATAKAYGINNCKVGESIYAVSDSLISLNNQVLGVILGSSESEEIAEPAQ